MVVPTVGLAGRDSVGCAGDRGNVRVAIPLVATPLVAGGTETLGRTVRSDNRSAGHPCKGLQAVGARVSWAAREVHG